MIIFFFMFEAEHRKRFRRFIHSNMDCRAGSRNQQKGFPRKLQLKAVCGLAEIEFTASSNPLNKYEFVHFCEKKKQRNTTKLLEHLTWNLCSCPFMYSIVVLHSLTNSVYKCKFLLPVSFKLFSVLALG
jgi:hypothetical protein